MRQSGPVGNPITADTVSTFQFDPEGTIIYRILVCHTSLNTFSHCRVVAYGSKPSSAFFPFPMLPFFLNISALFPQSYCFCLTLGPFFLSLVHFYFLIFSPVLSSVLIFNFLFHPSLNKSFCTMVKKLCFSEISNFRK